MVTQCFILHCQQHPYNIAKFAYFSLYDPNHPTLPLARYIVNITCKSCLTMCPDRGFKNHIEGEIMAMKCIRLVVQNIVKVYHAPTRTYAKIIPYFQKQKWVYY